HELERLRSQREAQPRLAQRAAIILACATGATNAKVGDDLGISSATVGKWRRRFVERRLAGLRDAPRLGAPKRIAEEDIERVVRLTMESAPGGGAAWSTRSLAEATGMSQAAVSRIWRTFAVKPSASASGDVAVETPFPDFVRDIVGLFLAPGGQALILLASRPPAPGTIVVDRLSPSHESAPSASLRALVAAARRAETREEHTVWWGPMLRLLAAIDRGIPRRVVVHVLLGRRRDHEVTLAHRWAAARTRFRIHFAGSDDAWLETTERAMEACRALLEDERPLAFEGALDERLAQGGAWPYFWTKVESGD
ncbi:MAG: helix-turn-helix domain-containing protein, partial [Acidobacteriota bacterium]